MTKRSFWLLVVFLLAAGGLGWWFFHLRLGAWRPALDSRELACRVLGEYLAHAQPGAKALVLGNPFTQSAGQSSEIYAFDRAEIRGLSLGFQAPGTVKEVFPAIRTGALERPQSARMTSDTTTPLSFLVADDVPDQLLRDNPGFNLVVSLIGVPANLTESQAWKNPGKPQFAFLLPDWRILGSPNSVRDAFSSGKIVAAVLSRPGAPPEDDSGRPMGDYQAAFDRRFMLVTQTNVDELMRVYPRLF